MKQNITDEQFLSLPFEQSLRLMEELGYPQENASKEFYNNNKKTIAIRFAYIIKKITIGKMIGIITQNNTITQMKEVCKIPDEPEYGFEWYLEVFHDVDAELITEQEEELCDALWNAVKKIV